MHSKKFLFPIFVVLGLGVLIILYNHDPSYTQWSPKCVMLALTGYKCPGCGIQRFVHHLMHGEVAEALRYNYFAAIVLPYLVIAVGSYAFVGTRWGKAIQDKLLNRYVAYTYIALYFVWWIVRNIFDL